MIIYAQRMLFIVMILSHTFCSTSPIITHQEEIDLNLFHSHDNKTLFNAIDKTITKVGSDALLQMVRSPISDIALLEKRQSTIRFWLEHKEMREAIKQLLYQFAKNESLVDTLWTPHDSLCKTTLEDFYFENDAFKHLNSSPTALNMLQVANVGNLFAPLIEHLLLHFFISNTLAEKLHINCTHHHHHGHDHHDSSAMTRALYNVYNVIHWGMHFYGVKQLYDVVKQKAAVAKTVQTNLIAASTCLESLKKAYNLLKDHKDITVHLSQFDAIRSFLESPDSQKLIQLLEKETFKGTPSLWSNIGVILAAQSLSKENAAFHNAMKALGEIDAYIAIAQLYEDHQDTPTPYSFAHYACTCYDRPYIDAYRYWSPLIKGSQAQDHFILGSAMPPIAIITGPNAAGKSTTLKSMALIALLAQTITLVPAQQVIFTPFAKITTFINHTDSSGSSLFTTELTKANLLIDSLQKQSASEFSLIVFDELFKSTSPEKGQEKAYSLLKHLGGFKQCLCIATTHYPKPTILESENSAIFKNFVAQAHKTPEGSIVYSLQPGCSLSNQSFDVLQAQGIQGNWW